MTRDERTRGPRQPGVPGSTRTMLQPDGELRSVGVLQPGTYRLGTEAPERVEITEGRCRVKLAETQEWAEYGPGESFHVPGTSHYELEVTDALDFVVHYGDVERCD